MAGKIEKMMDEEGFKKGVYMIDIGQNDLLVALYTSNLTYKPVAQKIPSFLAEIKLAIQVNQLFFFLLSLKLLSLFPLFLINTPKIINITTNCLSSFELYIYITLS